MTKRITKRMTKRITKRMNIPESVGWVHTNRMWAVGMFLAERIRNSYTPCHTSSAVAVGKSASEDAQSSNKGSHPSHHAAENASDNNPEDSYVRRSGSESESDKPKRGC